MSEQKKQLMEDLQEIVEKIAVQQEKDVLTRHAKEIAIALIPQVEDLVAKKVRQHLRQIATFILDLTKDKEKSKDDKKEDSGSKDS